MLASHLLCSVDMFATLRFFHRMFVPVIPTEVIQDMKKTFDVEVTRTETRTSKKIITSVDSRQVRTGISEIRGSQIPPPSEREGGDDWCVLFDIVREKPAIASPGTLCCKRGSALSVKKYLHQIDSCECLCQLLLFSLLRQWHPLSQNQNSSWKM